MQPPPVTRLSDTLFSPHRATSGTVEKHERNEQYKIYQCYAFNQRVCFSQCNGLSIRQATSIGVPENQSAWHGSFKRVRCVTLRDPCNPATILLSTVGSILVSLFYLT